MSDEVIPLSRFRAMLARAGSPRRRYDELVSNPKAKDLVPKLPALELFWLLREVGLRDAADLLSLASPAQIQTFLDLDVWDREQLLLPATVAWIEALTDTGVAHAAAVTRALDVEMPSLVLALAARIYDLTLEEAAPEDSENAMWPTPDGFHLVEWITDDPDEARTLERWLDGLYRADLELGRRVVMGARWELPTELEEMAARWRGGRMADLGFPDPIEALEVYRFLDPATVRPGEHTAPPPAPEPLTLPAPYVPPLEREGFLQRVLASLPDEAELHHLENELALLFNRVLVADRVPPGDLAATQVAVSRATDTLSLGLELVSGGDLDEAVIALRTVAFVRIFRAGFSLGLQLRRLVDTLLRRARLGPAPGSKAYLDGPYLELVEGLMRTRPEWTRTLDEPAGQGFRALRSRDDIGRAARAVEELALLSTLLVERLEWTGPGAAPGFAEALRGKLADLGPPEGALDLLERGIRERFAEVPATLRGALERALRCLD